MKLRLCILLFFVISLCQLDVQASSHKHHHKHKKSCCEITKKIDEQILKTVNNIQNTVTTINDKEKATFLIYASDIGTTGYVITKPGSYALAEDVSFNPGQAPTVGVTFNGGGGSGAAGFAVVSGGQVRGVVITNSGSGYTSAPTVTFAGPGTGVTGNAVLASGSVASVNITAGGSGFVNTVQAAITIASSNVNLMLNNHRLSQANSTVASIISSYSPNRTNPSSQVPYVIGILVPDMNPTGSNVNEIDLESIYIGGDQAIIDGFSMYGIRVFGHTADIRISNLTIENSGLLASHYLRPNASYSPNGVPGTPGPAPFDVGGLSIGETDFDGLGPQFFTQNTGPSVFPYVGTAQNRVNSVVLDNVSCLNNFYMGLSLSNSTDVTISRCHFDGTLCDDPNLLAIGAAFGPSDISGEQPNILNMVVGNTTSNNTQMLGDFTTELPNSFALNGTCFGAFASSSNNLTFTNFNCDHTISTFAADQTNGNAITSAFACAALIDCSFDQCSFSDVQGLEFPSGFNLFSTDIFFNTASPSRNIRITNSIASNIQENANLQIPVPLTQDAAYGFYFLEAINVSCENLVASDVILNGPQGPNGYCAGFVFDGGEIISSLLENDNYSVKGCTAQRILCPRGGNAKGFRFRDQDDPGSNNAIRTISVEDCVAEGCQAFIPTLTTSPQTGLPFGNIQGTAQGFQADRFRSADFNGPTSFTRCKALHNKGAVSIDTLAQAGILYSAGFFGSGSTLAGRLPAINQVYYDCEATDNVYGFLLLNSINCSIRNCRADFNVDSTGTTGEGFTDLGVGGTPALPGVSKSLFENNRAFGNGPGSPLSNTVGTNRNYNVFYGAGQTLPVPTLAYLLSTTFSPVSPTNGNYSPVWNVSIQQ